MNEDRFIEICRRISQIYNNKESIELKELEDLFVDFTKLLYMRTFNIDRPPMVEVIDSDQFAGCYNGYISFYINRNQIKNFQDGMALSLFETICHELRHYIQKREYEKVNVKNSIIEKDEFLKRKINNYYNNNYSLLAEEVEAFLLQGPDAMNILTALNITPSEEEILKSNKDRSNFSDNTFITMRYDGDKARDLSDLFCEFFTKSSSEMDEFSKENFLEFRPCINIEYKVIDGKFVRRTSEEIAAMYNSWQRNEIKLNGVPFEIETYFKYLLDVLKITEQKDMVPQELI